MTSSKFEKIWYILSNFNIELNENINKNVICMICNKIMNDPYIGSCECHYCGGCIKNYIDNDDKYCPGTNTGCSEEFLIVDQNVVKDFSMRRNIANTIVHCPNASCSVSTELENMDEHIRICRLKPTECPYESIGCENKKVEENDIKDHLNLDMVEHSRLLAESINNLRNDVYRLGIILEMRNTEIKELKEEIKENKKEINKLKLEVTANNSYMEDINNKIGDLDKEVYRMELDNIKTNTNCIMHKYNNEIEDIRKETKRCLDEMEVMKRKLNDVKIDNTFLRDNNDFSITMTKYLEEIKNVKNEAKKNNAQMKEMRARMSELILNATFDNVWRITDFTEKSNNPNLYYSTSFYKDNYKLCLAINVTHNIVGEYCNFEIYVMKGEKDDTLKWPMRYTFKISVINQNSLKTHLYWKCNIDECTNKFAFEKPKHYMNSRISFGHIDISQISDIQGLLVHDSVIVCCSLFPEL